MIEHVVILSLLCFGVHCVTRQGNVLGFWERLISDSEGNQITEMLNPITECVICMPSFWGVVYFSLLGILPVKVFVTFSSIATALVVLSIVYQKLYSCFKVTYVILFFFVIFWVGPECKTVFIPVICSAGANFLCYEFINK